MRSCSRWNFVVVLPTHRDIVMSSCCLVYTPRYFRNSSRHLGYHRSGKVGQYSGSVFNAENLKHGCWKCVANVCLSRVIVTSCFVIAILGCLSQVVISIISLDCRTPKIGCWCLKFPDRPILICFTHNKHFKHFRFRVHHLLYPISNSRQYDAMWDTVLYQAL